MTEKQAPGGYMGKTLRVDLTRGSIHEEPIEESILRKYIGGAGLGAYYLYKEVPPEVGWSDPENRLIFSIGPLNAVRMAGAGSFNLSTVGALTNGATTSQANGFLGAYLKSCGLDAVVVQGKADQLSYLYIRDGSAEIRDARHLRHKDTYETETLIKQELGKKKHELSVFSIGPAGENLVKFACVVGDNTHVAAHNGVGAAMGSKQLKAIVVERGKTRSLFRDKEKVESLVKEISEIAEKSPMYSFGTSTGVRDLYPSGQVPVRNYRTSIFSAADQFDGRHRSKFELKLNPCFACPFKHCYTMKITEGRYAGYVGEEPEYEQWAAWGPLIDQTDVAAAMVLSNDIDQLGMDTNEAGYLIAWVMECVEKNLLTAKELGVNLKWGDVDATRAMLKKIAFREGFGDVLAEGVKRAANKIGGEAANLAVFTHKGNSPRGHDHRARWWEMFDTCVSSTGTMETPYAFNAKELELPAGYDRFSPEAISTLVAQTKGTMQFEDSLTLCRFTMAGQFSLVCGILNEVTGWDYTVKKAVETGKRIVNLLKVFNLRRGISADLDKPSVRYSSAAVDGPAQGKSIMPHWQDMLRNYYHHMGWDVETSKPLPDTLKALGLESIVADIWGND